MRLHKLREGYTFTRLLIEMALASNAPTTLKVKVLFKFTFNTYGGLDIYSAFACSLPLLLLSSRT
jgi:hypothetical protein